MTSRRKQRWLMDTYETLNRLHRQQELNPYLDEPSTPAVRAGQTAWRHYFKILAPHGWEYDLFRSTFSHAGKGRVAVAHPEKGTVWVEFDNADVETYRQRLMLLA